MVVPITLFMRVLYCIHYTYTRLSTRGSKRERVTRCPIKSLYLASINSGCIETMCTGPIYICMYINLEKASGLNVHLSFKLISYSINLISPRDITGFLKIFFFNLYFIIIFTFYRAIVEKSNF